MFTAVADQSQVAEARRLVCNYARSIGIGDAYVDKAAIVATELATNLIKHGGGGHVHAGRFDDAAGTGLELLALDRGRGMADVQRCSQDGYSTAGSPGNGLGAIARLADDMRIYSRSGLGTAVMARLRCAGAGASRRTQVGAALAPYPGETVCGDGFAFHEHGSSRTVMLVDGSGHGVEAARAVLVAVQAFAGSAMAPCEAIMEATHRALTPTRGAAVAVARIDAAARTVRFVGVGNIGAVLMQGTVTRHMVSHNGTAGHVAPRIREFTYDFTGDPLVILHSDGLTSRWDLAAYPGLVGQHPSLVAGVLLRDHRRGRDDTSVVAIRAVDGSMT
jgi:anti-sigma regulatory factor (Ser/Thr protein kinase)